jgi:hypothetical protein
MKVISHETPGVHLPAGLFARLTEGVEKALPIGIIKEHGLASVAPAH